MLAAEARSTSLCNQMVYLQRTRSIVVKYRRRHDDLYNDLSYFDRLRIHPP